MPASVPQLSKELALGMRSVTSQAGEAGRHAAGTRSLRADAGLPALPAAGASAMAWKTTWFACSCCTGEAPAGAVPAATASGAARMVRSDCSWFAGGMPSASGSAAKWKVAHAVVPFQWTGETLQHGV